MIQFLNNETFWSSELSYILYEKLGVLNINIFFAYNCIFLKKDNTWLLIFEIKDTELLLIYNTLIHKNLLEICTNVIRNFFIGRWISIASMNILQYVPNWIEQKIQEDMLRIENSIYFTKKNKILHFYECELRQHFFYLWEEGFTQLTECLYRVFDSNSEFKFLYNDYIGVYKMKRYIIKGCFHRFSDVVNVMNWYSIFQLAHMNIPQECYIIQKNFNGLPYYFSGFSFLDAKPVTLKYLYGNKQEFLLEIFKLQTIFSIQRSCTIDDINQLLWMMPWDYDSILDVENLFNNPILTHTYTYFNLDICHFLWKDSKVYIVDFNKINTAPLIVTFIYTLLFLISIDIAYCKNPCIQKNITILLKSWAYTPKSLSLPLLSYNFLHTLVNHIVEGMEIDLGKDIHSENIRNALIWETSKIAHIIKNLI